MPLLLPQLLLPDNPIVMMPPMPRSSRLLARGVAPFTTLCDSRALPNDAADREKQGRPDRRQTQMQSTIVLVIFRRIMDDTVKLFHQIRTDPSKKTKNKKNKKNLYTSSQSHYES